MATSRHAPQGQNVVVRDIQPGEARAAVAVLARGFRDNPVPTALFGNDPDVRQQRLQVFFGAMFEVMDAQTPLVALDGERIVGVAGIAPPTTCQATPRQILTMLPALAPCGPASVLRIARVNAAWGSLDPSERHSHFGPFAVEVGLQGMGIGTTMLEEYCRHLDAAQVMSYLETETEANVRLYSRFGFEVSAERQVLGVPNWFMRRMPRADDALPRS